MCTEQEELQFEYEILLRRYEKVDAALEELEGRIDEVHVLIGENRANYAERLDEA